MEIGMKEKMGVADKMILLLLRSGRVAVNCAKNSLKRIHYSENIKFCAHDTAFSAQYMINGQLYYLQLKKYFTR